jgi:SH3-like domain-containing protein
VAKINYLEWSRKIKHTLIFNDLWDGICDGDTSPIKPTVDKELAIWMNKDKKAYALIVASVSEEVSHHIKSIKDSWGALKKLKDLYDSHSELELIQL